MDRKSQIETLNDLIQINNDRIDGYNTAIKNLEEGTDLRHLFSSFVEQSQHFNHDLRENVRNLGGIPDKDTTITGKIYRAWMEVKAKLGGTDREAILSSCEFGEDAAKGAYQAAMQEADLSDDQKSLISKQYSELLSAHDKIKLLRNLQ